MDMDINLDKVDHYLQMVGEMSLQLGIKLILACAVYLVGKWLINKVLRVIEIGFEKKKVEATLHQFLLSIIGTVLKVILIIIFASMIGIETTSLIAVLGAAGLAIGLALQGSLANFAGGVLILLFRPFKKDDVIDAQGYIGKVNEIQIFNTILITADNQRIIIPNGQLSNGCVKNINAEGTRRVDFIFGIGYDDDVAKAKAVLMSLVEADERTLTTKPTDVWLGEHGDSSINLYLRPWVNSSDYWPYYFGMMEKVKEAFDKEGITIPYPQRDVHIHQTSNT